VKLEIGLALGAIAVLALIMVAARAWRARRGRRLRERLRQHAPAHDPTTTHEWAHSTSVLRLDAIRAATAAAAPAPAPAETTADPLRARAAALRSRDAARVRAALAGEPLPRALVSDAVALLAWDEVAAAALDALRTVASDNTGQLLDHLLDGGEEFAIRRRIPILLAHCPTQRVIDGLARALADRRFEVRYRAGRALRRLVDHDATLVIDRSAILRAVLREAEVQHGVWESRRLLDTLGDEADDTGTVVRERSNRSLEHVFNLLALVLPREPILVAYRGLHADDVNLKRTALDYLESALPSEVRSRLWPFLRDDRPAAAKPAAEVRPAIDRLLESQASVQIDLEEIRKRLREQS
jgi:hypothetical protein